MRQHLMGYLVGVVKIITNSKMVMSKDAIIGFIR